MSASMNLRTPRRWAGTRRGSWRAVVAHADAEEDRLCRARSWSTGISMPTLTPKRSWTPSALICSTSSGQGLVLLLVGGDAPGDESTREVAALVDDNLVAQPGEFRGTRQPRRPGPDHTDAVLVHGAHAAVGTTCRPPAPCRSRSAAAGRSGWRAVLPSAGRTSPGTGLRPGRPARTCHPGCCPRKSLPRRRLGGPVQCP